MKYKKIIILLIVLTILKETILLLFAEYNETDLNLYITGANAILKGENPYSIPEYYMSNHPPGIYYTYAIIVLLVGTDYRRIQLLTIIFAWITSILVYYTSKSIITISQSKEKGRFLSINNIKKKKNLKFLPFYCSIIFLLDFSVNARYMLGNNDIIGRRKEGCYFIDLIDISNEPFFNRNIAFLIIVLL